MPAKSIAQQQLFGMALAVRRGEMKRSDADKDVLDKIGQIKYNNKKRLAKFIKEKYNIDVNPNSMDFFISSQVASV